MPVSSQMTHLAPRQSAGAVVLPVMAAPGAALAIALICAVFWMILIYSGFAAAGAVLSAKAVFAAGAAIFAFLLGVCSCLLAPR